MDGAAPPSNVSLAVSIDDALPGNVTPEVPVGVAPLGDDMPIFLGISVFPGDVAPAGSRDSTPSGW